LLSVENITVEFSNDSISYIAEIAHNVNSRTENIGARRLYTILEKVLEDLLFDAPDSSSAMKVTIDRNYVDARLAKIVEDDEVSRYIL
jgi:ATP-dependent HslUV protease ATP-binding subunit HslU